MYSTPTVIRSRSSIRASVKAVMPFVLPETYRVFHRLSKVLPGTEPGDDVLAGMRQMPKGEVCLPTSPQPGRRAGRLQSGLKVRAPPQAPQLRSFGHIPTPFSVTDLLKDVHVPTLVLMRRDFDRVNVHLYQAVPAGIPDVKLWSSKVTSPCISWGTLRR